jgi:hypothetical protein
MKPIEMTGRPDFGESRGLASFKLGVLGVFQLVYSGVITNRPDTH